MHARFRLEKTIRIGALDLEDGALDARLLALAHVEDLDLEAFALRPPAVEAHQHVGPVLRLGAAGAGGDLELHVAGVVGPVEQDRKSTRLNSSHSQISYAVFCLKKKKKK